MGSGILLSVWSSPTSLATVRIPDSLSLPPRIACRLERPREACALPGQGGLRTERAASHGLLGKKRLRATRHIPRSDGQVIALCNRPVRHVAAQRRTCQIRDLRGATMQPRRRSALPQGRRYQDCESSSWRRFG